MAKPQTSQIIPPRMAPRMGQPGTLSVSHGKTTPSSKIVNGSQGKIMGRTSASGIDNYHVANAKYNAGSIKGAWLDLEYYADRDAFLEACKKLHEDESDPEFMFHDDGRLSQRWNYD